MPVVKFDHIHLRSPDPEATATWFAQILGAEVAHVPGRIDVKFGDVVLFVTPVAEGDGIGAPPTPPHQGFDHIGLTVTGIDAFAAELRGKGVEFMKEPTTIRPHVRICYIRGPQGIWIELLERGEAAPC